ncbi:MAG: MarR family winged helix-turn-helix transcriptional regulator [Acidimicrobiales bacterium]
MTGTATRNPPSTATTVVEVAGRLRFGVTRLARLMRQQADAGLTPTQLAALATIDRCGPLPIGALAVAEQIRAPTATKIVDKLQDAGYVTRSDDPEDRRVKRVGLSAVGRAHLVEVRARKTAWLTARLGDLQPDELQALAGALDVLERLTAPPSPHAEEPT